MPRTLILIASALLAPAVLLAQAHPHYVHARTDLRAAQTIMRLPEEPNVRLTLERAGAEVDAAVREIDRAAVIDRKDLEDHPHIDTNLSRQERFRKMVDLLRSARSDIEQEEDNSRARDWRNAAFQHIDAALKSVHQAAIDVHLDREIGDF